MSRADPKPGRWLLPLVVGGLVAFTYVFVNALPSAPSEAAAPSPLGRSTSTTVAAATTTTTTLSPATLGLLDDVTAFEAASTNLVNEAQRINDEWDNNDLTFGEARIAFTDYRESVRAFRDQVVEAPVPDEASQAWASVIAAAEAMATAAEDMLTGLLDPDSASGRRAAHAALGTASEDFVTALSNVRTAVGG